MSRPRTQLISALASAFFVRCRHQGSQVQPVERRDQQRYGEGAKSDPWTGRQHAIQSQTVNFATLRPLLPPLFRIPLRLFDCLPACLLIRTLLQACSSLEQHNRVSSCLFVVRLRLESSRLSRLSCRTSARRHTLSARFYRLCAALMHVKRALLHSEYTYVNSCRPVLPCNCELALLIEISSQQLPVARATAA